MEFLINLWVLFYTIIMIVITYLNLKEKHQLQYGYITIGTVLFMISGTILAILTIIIFIGGIFL